jgi:glycine/serine hydroxymethyltransferase
VFLDIDPDNARRFCHELETVGIFIDEEARLGTAEVTHRGLRPDDMQEIAKLLSDAYLKGVSNALKPQIQELVRRGQRNGYN